MAKEIDAACDKELHPDPLEDIRIWSDLDFDVRNLRPFVPDISEAELKKMNKEDARKRILDSLGLTEEMLIPYPSLDASDPGFMDKFNLELYMNDARYFIESFLRIDTKDEGIRPFKLNIVQLAFLFNRTGRDVILKARQHGLTTLMLAYYLWDTMLNHGKKTVIMTHEKEASQLLLARAKLMYDSIPDVLKPALKSNTKDRMEFEGMNGSQIIVQVIKKTGGGEKKDKSGGTGRSKTIHNLLLSEPAFYDGVEDKDLAGLLEAVPVGEGGSITIESTPNGVGGFYYKECNAAKRGKINRKFFNLPWYINPDYDHEWKREKQRERHLDPTTEDGRRLWGQEYECSFLQSQSNYFPLSICAPTSKYQKRIARDPRGTRYPNYIHIFQEPNPGELYVIGVDCAKGLEHGDFSSVTVVSRETRCEVAQIYGKIAPEALATLVNWIGKKYNHAFVGVENEGNGLVVVDRLLDPDRYDYPNLFFYRNIHSTKAGSEGTPGWSTNRKTRDLMLVTLRDNLRDDTLHLAFKDRQEELEQFTIIDGKPQAPKGEKDDLVMSAAIASMLLEFPETMRRSSEVELSIRSYGG